MDEDGWVLFWDCNTPIYWFPTCWVFTFVWTLFTSQSLEKWSNLIQFDWYFFQWVQWVWKTTCLLHPDWCGQLWPPKKMHSSKTMLAASWQSCENGFRASKPMALYQTLGPQIHSKQLWGDRIHGTGTRLYIYRYEWLTFYGVGKYTSPMDPIGEPETEPGDLFPEPTHYLN